MLLALALLGFAGLLHWCVGRLRAEMTRKALAGLVEGTVLSVTRRSGRAFGDQVRWHAVTVGYVDDAGEPQVVTHDAPGSGWWRPEVGAVVHLYRTAVWPGRVYRDRMADKAGELVLECDEQVVLLLRWVVRAMVVGAAVAVVVALVR